MVEQAPRQTWDEFYSSEYSLGAHARNIAEHAPLFEEIGRNNPRSALEVGIGNGGMTIFVGSLGIEAVGVDNDDAVLDRAIGRSAHVPSVRFVKGDAFHLDQLFGPAQFDVAFSQGFFEHFADDEIRRLVEQQLRVSRRVVFSVPSDEYPRQDFGNERLMSPSDWLRILSDVGVANAYYYAPQILSLRHAVPRKLTGKRTVPFSHVVVALDQPATRNA